jgi:hypothetical protein
MEYIPWTDLHYLLYGIFPVRAKVESGVEVGRLQQFGK